MSNRFKPTHEIILTDRGGDRRTIQVQLEADGRGAGPAYTRAEWDADDAADWEYNPALREGWQGEPPTSAGWTFQGEPSYPDHSFSVRTLR